MLKFTIVITHYLRHQTGAALKEKPMQHIVTLNTRNLKDSKKTGGCGECQTSCQSACKTSCGIANQKCENPAKSK